MSKDISKYIHYCIGQPCTYDDPYQRAFDLKGVVTERIIQEIRNPQLTGAVQNARPHLRKIEDMTEEEMIGLLQSMVPADMEDKPTDEDYALEMFYNDGGNMVDADVAVGAGYSCSCYEGQIAIRYDGSIDLFDEDSSRQGMSRGPMTYHYLLSKGFDLFGLIDSGAAIDSKTLQPQQS